MSTVLPQPKLTFEDKVLLAIERLLLTSMYPSFNVVSVVDEANKYCYKTVDGTIGTVDKNFIHDRVNAGLITKFITQ
jgi:hypothetical protein